MDTVVQMNASLVEEATAAATSMANQATALARSVAQFRVAGDAPAGAPQIEAAPVALPRAPGTSRRAPAVQPSREPVLAAAGGDEWKEF
jgi:methyl-accepting chemotaxis protein